MQSVKTFCGKFGVAGLKTFLSLEYGRDFGDKIIEIGEKLPGDDAKKVFAKYSELVAQLDDVQGVLKESYHQDGTTDEISKIKESILKKGKDLLGYFADSLASGVQPSSDDVISYLEQIEAGALTFFLTFKALKEDGNLPVFEEIKNLSIEVKDTNNITDKEKEMIKGLYRLNYKDDPEFLKVLLQKFDERSKNPETKFYLLKYQDNVKAVQAFTPDENRKGVLYGHSTNVDASLRGISIGNTMFEKVRGQLAKDNILTADCAAYMPIGSKNIETGYIATKFYDYMGHPSFFVERNDSKNDKYWGKTMRGKEQEIIKMYQDGHLPENVKVVLGSEQAEVSLESINEGYVLTRYFKDKSSNKWYAVLERTA